MSGLKKIVANADGSLDFFSGSSKAVLNNFKRSSLKTETGTTSGVICLYGMMDGQCQASVANPSAEKEFAMNFTYKLIGSGESEEQYPIPYETPKPAPPAGLSPAL